MKILIMGATGMIGHRLWLGLSEKYDVEVLIRKPIDSLPLLNKVNRNKIHVIVDVLDSKSVESVFESCRPDLVINCIGVVKQLDLAKNSIASIALNSLFPHQLAEICKKYNSRMIQFSTDCVFKGDKGLYLDSDQPDATDLYGKTKALGEIDYSDNVLTLRTSFIGREIFPHGSLVTWFEDQNGKSVQGFSKAIYSGLPTQTIVNIISDYIIPNKELSGIYNLSSDPINKYDLLVKIKSLFSLDVEVGINDRFEVDRSLNSDKLKELIGFNIPHWDILIKDLLIDDEFYMELKK